MHAVRLHVPPVRSLRPAFCTRLCASSQFLVADFIPFTAGFPIYRPHIFFVYMWVCGACLGTQTHHSGYRLPWNAEIEENPEFHDFHHMRFNTCYGTMGWLDALHGTDGAFKEHKVNVARKRAEAEAEWQRQRAEALKAKGE